MIDVFLACLAYLPGHAWPAIMQKNGQACARPLVARISVEGSGRTRLPCGAPHRRRQISLPCTLTQAVDSRRHLQRWACRRYWRFMSTDTREG